MSIYFAIDPALLKYEGIEKGAHKFKGILWYVEGMYINDGNPEIYDKYRGPLKKAGFRIE